MNRLTRRFAALKKEGKKAFIAFMTAGDPSFSVNEKCLLALAREGVDAIELGIPFSDPVADGPVIQDSSFRSLQRGTTLQKVLTLTARVRRKTDIPILFMSYLNPVLRYGIGRFAREAARCGVDGLIVPDLTPDEGREIASALRERGVSLVYLAAPTSSDARKRMIGRASSGFVYYVSVAGVTGVKKGSPAAVAKDIAVLKKSTRLPVCVGFGISAPEQARRFSRFSDGVIVGSAIVHYLRRNGAAAPARIGRELIRPFLRAMGRAG